jgi:hypothetical protein
VPSDLSIVTSKKHIGQYIEVSTCGGFSIGSDPITLWAMAQSGWLEIQPSAKYRQMYNRITEAIDIYYFLTDQYEIMKRLGNRALKKNLSVDELILRV